MNAIRYSYGATVARGTMPLSIGHGPQIHAAGIGAKGPPAGLKRPLRIARTSNDYRVARTDADKRASITSVDYEVDVTSRG